VFLTGFSPCIFCPQLYRIILYIFGTLNDPLFKNNGQTRRQIEARRGHATIGTLARVIAGPSQIGRCVAGPCFRQVVESGVVFGVRSVSCLCHSMSTYFVGLASPTRSYSEICRHRSPRNFLSFYFPCAPSAGQCLHLELLYRLDRGRGGIHYAGLVEERHRCPNPGFNQKMGGVPYPYYPSRISVEPSLLWR
jgi:hypothetical protein